MFAEELKRRRKALGMSQTQLAEALGVYQPTIARWETGVITPRLPAATLALVDTLKPLPKSERRSPKGGRPKQKPGKK